ncbi:hypothetical protein PR202_ga23232 [Eleusine coracana subsp. coracana]|uniref:Clp1 P-loop domain-containing protein n=1 Tax=Eleusine coracana subsp. coracana TaxID=191504 RepID=A0AAV5D4P0_ELECO|nr:hypothetical protein PR202_ga23232 [Eleusine coracana subsp. coracana]
MLCRYGKVGYLDTDVGQPEFAPPGCISFHVVDEAIPGATDILVAGFCADLLNPTLREAERCHFIAPFCAGFDMLVEMLRHICPTIVVQLRITMESKNLPDGIFWQEDGMQRSEMININAPFRDASDRSVLIRKDAVGMRERRLAEYLKQCFPSHIPVTTNKELAYALASLPPYQVPFSDVKVTHLHCEVGF